MNRGIKAHYLEKIHSCAKSLGKGLGWLSIGMCAAEIVHGDKKIIGEGGLDLAMSAIGFVPYGGWAISSVYFGGKLLLEMTGNDFWNK